MKLRSYLLIPEAAKASITLGVLVSPQDTTVSWQRDKNLAWTLQLPVPTKPDRRDQYNDGTASSLHGEKCWAR